ncbi:hypothetical protein [Mesorhizobium sp. M0619]|uniref:hypothetical protein n=1 Tax=unclassified Mesorhizobium TaxID=325217 RepID=UPI00333B3FC8
MAESLKSFSVLIAWSDNDLEQGDYAATVRAANADDAEAMVRTLMADSAGDDDRETDGYGRLIECTEGAIWKASDLEKALRALRAVAIRDDDSDQAAFDAAVKMTDDVLADIDRVE